MEQETNIKHGLMEIPCGREHIGYREGGVTHADTRTK